MQERDTVRGCRFVGSLLRLQLYNPVNTMDLYSTMPGHLFEI